MRGVVWVADLQGPGVDRRAGRASWSPGDLVGRERECALLDALLSTVAERGAALVLWGEPGVGKTALLEYAARTTSADVLKAQGVESEAVLPFATLADVLLPLREHFRDLPRVQREALEACLALSGRASTNPYAVCVGAMNVLAAAGELRPVVVLVDDMQWVDPSSQRVLLFTARRLACERVAIVLTVREDKGELGAYASLPSIEVSGLSRPACAELLRSHDLDVAPAVLDDLAGTSGGNPLALLETASSLSAAQLRGEQPMTQLPTLGRHLERAWSSRIRELPEATRNALAVVAASRFSTIRTIETALAAIGLSLADLSPAEEAGLITAIGDGYRFRHPILRPLVLQRTPLAQRLHAFHALAEVSSGTLRAWYLAAATTGPDNEVAQTLVEAALDARRRSGFEAAALAWRRAADLTPEGPVRADRLRLAATDAFLGGSSLDAAAWCDDALRITTDPVVCADINLLRGRIYTWIGQPSRAHQLLVEAARSIRDVDPPRACACSRRRPYPRRWTPSLQRRYGSPKKRPHSPQGLPPVPCPARWFSDRASSWWVGFQKAAPSSKPLGTRSRRPIQCANNSYSPWQASAGAGPTILGRHAGYSLLSSRQPGGTALRQLSRSLSPPGARSKPGRGAGRPPTPTPLSRCAGRRSSDRSRAWGTASRASPAWTRSVATGPGARSGSRAPVARWDRSALAASSPT